MSPSMTAATTIRPLETFSSRPKGDIFKESRDRKPRLATLHSCPPAGFQQARLSIQALPTVVSPIPRQLGKQGLPKAGRIPTIHAQGFKGAASCRVGRGSKYL